MDKKTLTYITLFTAIIALALAAYVFSSILIKPSGPAPTTPPAGNGIRVVSPARTPSFTFSPKEPENARILITPPPSGAPTQEKPAKAGKLEKVDITAAQFSPSSVEINTGDVITWTNKDTVPHKIIGKSWRSGMIEPGLAFSQEFDVAATYQYYIEDNPNISGTVIVK